jgi:hypothetical protein
MNPNESKVVFGWVVRWNGAVPFHLCWCLLENGWSGAVPDTGIYGEDAEPFHSKKGSDPSTRFSRGSTRSIFFLLRRVFPAASTNEKSSPPCHPSPGPQRLPPDRFLQTAAPRALTSGHARPSGRAPLDVVCAGWRVARAARFNLAQIWFGFWFGCLGL